MGVTWRLDVEGARSGEGLSFLLVEASECWGIRGTLIYFFVQEKVAPPLYLAGPIIRDKERKKAGYLDHGRERSGRELSLHIGERQRTDLRVKAICHADKRTSSHLGLLGLNMHPRTTGSVNRVIAPPCTWSVFPVMT